MSYLSENHKRSYDLIINKISQGDFSDTEGMLQLINQLPEYSSSLTDITQLTELKGQCFKALLGPVDILI